jgi:flagellar biogenesis protein FliO
MEWIGQMGAVGAVLGLLAATLWWLRRRGIAGILPARRAARRRMECLERLALGPQHTLHLVRLGDRTMLVAASPAGCALVESFSSREIDGAREAGR